MWTEGDYLFLSENPDFFQTIKGTLIFPKFKSMKHEQSLIDLE